jgi:hypothetical protein
MSIQIPESFKVFFHDLFHDAALLLMLCFHPTSPSTVVSSILLHPFIHRKQNVVISYTNEKNGIARLSRTNAIPFFD